MKPYILDFRHAAYPYLEEINEGIVKQVARRTSLPRSAGQSILDVGCGQGVLAQALRQFGAEIVGIDSHPTAVARAASRIDRAICRDLSDLANVCLDLTGRKFDYIIFSDVLEHTYDPVEILRQYIQFLKPTGRILISVPNAVNWWNRFRFLFGVFRYEETGPMDRTHIRFFTPRTARDLVQAAGLVVETRDYTPFIVRAFLPWIKRLLIKPGARQSGGGNTRALIDSNGFRIYLRFIYPIEYAVTRLCPSLFAFRIILVAGAVSR